jgi:uncharacterized protein (TIGR02271 family)
MRDDPERGVADGETSAIRHEEVADVGTRWQGVGAVRASKHVEYERYDEVVPHQVEDVELERVAAEQEDSGEIETLPDGSISIPVFEEELVVTTRTVLRERVIVRKRTVEESQRIVADLRKERVEIDADEGVEVEGA